MTRVSWSSAQDRVFETGLDRGVLYPKNGPAVPWNGLTAVDENGGEGTVEYYIDGRPFLYFPKPKEFSATLKAYTYPDEFSELMGITEIADGMYLDSQIADSFDLCYRTLIGDANKGTTAGYKIHLIYNAVVAAPGASYETLSNDVNPNMFSWDIQAVPVPVAGYRPTAHIMIDTRHIDDERLSSIEDLIYGSDSLDAGMPQPSTIFDALAFGGAIIITDHGNGLWSAEGSYEHVEILEDGMFRLNGINATNNGDGTWEIETTTGITTDEITELIMEPL